MRDVVGPKLQLAPQPSAAMAGEATRQVARNAIGFSAAVRSIAAKVIRAFHDGSGKCEA